MYRHHIGATSGRECLFLRLYTRYLSSNRFPLYEAVHIKTAVSNAPARLLYKISFFCLPQLQNIPLPVSSIYYSCTFFENCPEITSKTDGRINVPFRRTHMNGKNHRHTKGRVKILMQQTGQIHSILLTVLFLVVLYP